MKTKTQLNEEIEKIPIFEMRELATKSNDQFIEDAEHKGICEISSSSILAMVTNGYKLVQFKDVYSPIMDEIPELEGYLKYHNGKGWLVIFPKEENYQIGEHSVGVILKNSVDKSSAINIELCVKVGEYTIMLPDKKKMRTIHLGKAKELLKSYQSFIIDVKNEWVTILQKLQSKELDESEVDALLNELRLTKRVKAELKQSLESYNLWVVFMGMIESFTKKVYRNPINQMQKLKRVAELCVDYAMLSKI